MVDYLPHVPLGSSPTCLASPAAASLTDLPPVTFFRELPMLLVSLPTKNKVKNQNQCELIHLPFGSSPTCLARLQAVSFADFPPSNFLKNAMISFVDAALIDSPVKIKESKMTS